MSSIPNSYSLLLATKILSNRVINLNEKCHVREERAQRVELPISIQPSSILPFLSAHPCSQKIYFSTRNALSKTAGFSFSYHAAGSVFSREIHRKLTSILDPAHPNMRFYGGHRFRNSPVNSLHPHWAPYNGYTFVLPAVELCCDSNGGIVIAINYYPPNGISKILQILSSMVLVMENMLPKVPKSHFAPALSVNHLTSFQTWDKNMTKILAHISMQKYQKIVLSRQKKFTFHPNGMARPLQILSALIEDSSSTNGSVDDANPYYFCLQIDTQKAFLSCTPERLFKFDGHTVLTEALAGTVRRVPLFKEKEALDTLLNNKNVEEHEFVVEYVKAAISRCGLEPKSEGPNIRKLSRVMHLSTNICAHITQPRRDIDVRENIYNLLSELHPTPAVCGIPLETTLKNISELEQFDRGFFAGPFGWFSHQAAEFCVAIRSANVFDKYVTAYAGCGIVKASESVSEWDETELKMSAFTDLFCNLNTEKNEPYMERLYSFQKSASTTTLVSNDETTERQSFCSRLYLNNEIMETRKLVGSAPDKMHFSARSKADPGLNFFETQTLEDEPNINSLWGACAIDELVRNNICMFFVSPGSRSAPLTAGVKRNCFCRSFIAHDERGAGYMAVGYGKATGRAAAVITSSGTAIANVLPAVVEAYMEEIPMIVLSADRPPELRDIGSNQSIFQPGIFGNYVQWMKDVPCPSEDISLSNLLSDVDFAVYKSGSQSLFNFKNYNSGKGPVHLNFMFREKLAPDEQKWNREYVKTVGNEWKYSRKPLTIYTSINTTYPVNNIGLKNSRGMSVDDIYSQSLNLQSLVNGKKRGIILVGGGSGAVMNEDDALCIYELSELLKWPIVSDICGGLRLDCTRVGVLHHADVMLLSERFREGFQLDCVLQFGERITSKRIKNWIKEGKKNENGASHILVTGTTKRNDEQLTVTHRVEGNIHSMCRLLLNFDHTLNDNFSNKNNIYMAGCWYSELIRLSRYIGNYINQLFSEVGTDQPLNEVLCARVLSECVGKGRLESIYVGNSMPIRDLDMYGMSKPGRLGLRIVSNRGASGIDGIISSGMGFRKGLSSHTTIIVGDMSFIHDLNALHALKQEEEERIAPKARVTIVVINNGGGGIFSLLPIAKHSSLLTPMFDTPHSTEFEGVCETFGMEYMQVRTADELTEALLELSTRHRVVEVKVSCDHYQNASMHSNLSTDLIRAIESMLNK